MSIGLRCPACRQPIRQPFGLKACPNCDYPFDQVEALAWLHSADTVVERMDRQVLLDNVKLAELGNFYDN